MAEDKLKARPQIEGLDPLAGGDRLYNSSNDENATHYEVDNSERIADEIGVSSRAKPVFEVPNAYKFVQAPTPKGKNSSKEEQAEVAKGRKESKRKLNR